MLKNESDNKMLEPHANTLTYFSQKQKISNSYFRSVKDNFILR